MNVENLFLTFSFLFFLLQIEWVQRLVTIADEYPGIPLFQAERWTGGEGCLACSLTTVLEFTFFGIFPYQIYVSTISALDHMVNQLHVELLH